jgi:predicted ATPase
MNEYPPGAPSSLTRASEPTSFTLRGRHDECETLDRLVANTRQGQSSALVLRGEAGTGKTALLAEAASLAADGGILVLCGGGDPAARAVPLGVILDALVLTGGPPVDPARLRELSQSPDQQFSLLGELQEALEKAAHRAPLLVVVDDLQWADAASANALVTLSRRLATHRVSWLLALRRGELADAVLDAVVRDPARPPRRGRGRAGRP